MTVEGSVLKQQVGECECDVRTGQRREHHNRANLVGGTIFVWLAALNGISGNCQDQESGSLSKFDPLH